MNASVEMPKYKCHKIVHALKIKDIQLAPDGGNTLIPEEDGYAAFDVTGEFIQKHLPHRGGYYVVYEDGYKSFSPAEAFESGYTRI